MRDDNAVSDGLQLFLERSRGAPPQELLVRALTCHDGPGVAIDLGCGAGNETIALLEAGWRVHAVDAGAPAIELVNERALGNQALQTHQMRFSEFAFPPQVDLVCALFALPFQSPDEFARTWAAMASALRPGGLFAGQLFGPRDDWVVAFPERMAGQNRAELDVLLEGFEVLELEEMEADGAPTVGESKHWHLYHVLARCSVT